MVATASPTPETVPVRESNPWRPVKRCQTIEAALIQLNQLRRDGVQSSLLMDSGITVIARRG